MAEEFNFKDQTDQESYEEATIGDNVLTNKVIDGSIVRNSHIRKSIMEGQLRIGGVTLDVKAGEDIQAAIDLVNKKGGGRVILKNGTHKPGTDIILYSNVYLEGENSESCILDFQNNAKGIKVVGSDEYTTGTLSVATGSTTVTGNGTNWTADMIGQSILLSGLWYPIVAVTATDELTIGLNYADTSLSGASYVICTPITDVKIDTLLIKNSNAAAIKVQYCNEFWSIDCNIQACAIGYDFDDSSNVNTRYADLAACVTAISYTNTHYFVIEASGSVITVLGGNAFEFNSCSNGTITSCFITGSAGDGMQFTSCSKLIVWGTTSKYSGGQGIELVSGNDSLQFSSVDCSFNTSDGIKMTATSDNCSIMNCQLYNNGGYGWNIAASSCNGNFIGDNNYSGNVSGFYNDSGIGTQIGYIADFIIGDTLLVSADTNRARQNASWTKVKEIKIKKICHSLRIYFEGAASSYGHAAIFKNGSIIGVDHYLSGGAYQQFTEDFYGFKGGDLIQIYQYNEFPVTYATQVRNFRIYIGEARYEVTLD